MKISPKIIAREWLIFLASYLFVFLIIIGIILCRNVPFDPVAFVFPIFFYVIVCFVRSVIWAIKTVKQPGEKSGETSAPTPGDQKLKPAETLASPKKRSGLFDWLNKYTDFSPKAILWFSISLLSVCVAVWVLGFFSVNWSHLTPEQQGKTAASMTTGLLKIFFAVGILIWGIKGKTEKLFAASLAFAAATIIAIYYYVDARQNAIQNAKYTNSQVAQNANALLEYAQQNGNGKQLEIKPTGNAELDTIFSLMQGFYGDYLKQQTKMTQELNALNEASVFDDQVLTNKEFIKAELDKRIASQNIINSFAENVRPLFASLKQQCLDSSVSATTKQNFLATLDTTIPKYNGMFDAWVEVKKTDEKLLQFYYENFSDYELKDDKLLFANSTLRQKYAELSQEIQSASAKVDEYQKWFVEFTKAGLKKLQ